MSAAFGQLAARLPDRQSLQLYVQGTPLDLEDVLAEETHRCEQAAGAAEDAAEDERATAIRRLGIAQEQSIRATALNVAPLTLRYFVICPWRPTGRPLRSGGRSRRALRVKASVHERAMRDSLRHVEGVRSDLEAMGVPARPLDGPGSARPTARQVRPRCAAHGRAARELHVPRGHRFAGRGRGRRGRERSRERPGERDLHGRAGPVRAQPCDGSAARRRRSSTSAWRRSRRGSDGCFT